jgi:alpha,alpha-trehalase
MPAAPRAAPSALFPGLLQEFALADGSADMKSFADAVPKASPEVIMDAYRECPPRSQAEVIEFVNDWFELPDVKVGHSEGDRSSSIAEHIDALWDMLVRRDGEVLPGESRIALPYRYVVPGGIFRESYYWDTYFTILGLRFHDLELCNEGARNLAHLIDAFGFVPNGNRTYYLTRSQPPLFFATLAAIGEGNPARSFAAFLPQLRREHAFWMSGEGDLRGEPRRVVRMPGGELLNRFWDDGDWPRDEAYKSDVALASLAKDRPEAELFRDVRAACESGWDFSSRWFGDQANMKTIMTTSIVPSDLNALLFGLENAIRLGAEEAGDPAVASEFRERAAARSAAMNTYLWNEAEGFFDDYDLSASGQRGSATPASAAALFCGVASQDQAARTADFIERTLLAPGGLLTSLHATGEQWDSPNGWAPLHWIAVEGLERYGHNGLAREIAARWLMTVNRVFEATGRLVEKYDVVNLEKGGGGEYPLQDGFGWTNGVTLALLRRYPDLAPGDGLGAPAPR